MNEPQKPLNPETETFMHAWLCKLYLLSGSEGYKVPSLKNGFCKFQLFILSCPEKGMYIYMYSHST